MLHGHGLEGKRLSHKENLSDAVNRRSIVLLRWSWGFSMYIGVKFGRYCLLVRLFAKLMPIVTIGSSGNGNILESFLTQRESILTIEFIRLRREYESKDR